MFVKVCPEIGFNDQAVAHWSYELVQPPTPPAALGTRTPARTPESAFAPAPRDLGDETVTPRVGVPGLTALVPAEAALGDPSFVLSVQGSNFEDGSVIVWNGSDEVTTFVSDTELTTQVDMASATTAGPVPVLVRNLDSTMSSALNFTLTAAPDEAPVPQPVPTLTLTFIGGGELVLEGSDAVKVQQYYGVPSSHLTVL